MKSQEAQQTTQEKHPKETTSNSIPLSDPKTIDSTLHSQIQVNNLGHFSRYKILDNNSFNFLPADLFLQILNYFTLYELYILKQVCKAWQQTIQSLPSIELLRTYEVSLRDTTLWHYLSAIINNESILAFIKEQLLPFQLQKHGEEKLSKITTFCTFILDGLILDDSALPSKKKMTSEYLIQQAQFIQQNIEKFNQPYTEKRKSGLIFLWQHYDIQLAVFKAYCELEGILTAMILLTQSWRFKIDRVAIICDLSANRWLRGEDLVFIEAYNFYLLSEMIKQSICLHTYFQNIKTVNPPSKQILDPTLHDQYQQRLIILDTLLARLTLPDWLQFLALDELDRFHYRTSLLAEALHIQHPVIPVQLSEPISSKLANIKEDRIPSKVLAEQARINFVLLSIRFNAENELLDDDDYIATLKPSSFLRKAYEQIQVSKNLIEVIQKEKKAFHPMEKHLQTCNKIYYKIQDQFENIAYHNLENKDEQNDDQDFQQPTLPSTLPTPIHQPVKIKNPVMPSSFNWRFALKIGGTLLLMLMSVGFITTGLGSLMGFSLLIALSLPLFAKVLLLTAGGIIFLASIAISICIGCSTKNISRNRQISIVPDKQPPANPSEIVSGHTSRMIQTFNQIPSSSQQEDIHIEGQDTSNLQYSSPLTQPYSIPPRNEIPQTIAISQQDLKDGLNTQSTYYNP